MKWRERLFSDIEKQASLLGDSNRDTTSGEAAFELKPFDDKLKFYLASPYAKGDV